MGVVVIICCLSSHYLSIRKLRAAMRLSDSSEETRKRHAREYRVVAGHWTAASSPDIFGETVDLLLDSQMLVVGIGWIFIVYVPAAIIWSQYSLQDSNAYLIGACCPGDELTPACDQLCRHGVNVAEGCLTQALGCGLSMSSFVVIIPPKIWSPTTFVAAKQTNNGIIIRILWALEPCLIQMILNYGLFLFYILTFIMTETFQVPDVWRMVLIIFPTMSGLQVTLFLWVIGCRHLIRMPVRLYHSIKGTFRKVGKLKVHPDTDCRGGCNCEIKHEAPRLWECRGSWRYRQLVLMICIFGSFGADANRHMPNIKYHFIWHLWLVRILMLAFFFVSRDEESDFHVLEHQGPGLGLLLDARQLRRAVVGHLKGRKHLIATKVRQYKATLMRMEETLAISYRWHPLVAQLGNGMEVNMSKWQLEAMVEAIDETRCLYVWIDKFSVPQDVYSTLQRTLISRMMSVYSSAHVTAALLSSEVETSRYCQVGHDELDSLVSLLDPRSLLRDPSPVLKFLCSACGRSRSFARALSF